MVTMLQKCGSYVKVALTWHSHVATRWQLGESGIDVVKPWPCMMTQFFKTRICIINVDGTAAFLHISPCYENISQIMMVSEMMLKYIVCVCIHAFGVHGMICNMHVCVCECTHACVYISLMNLFSKTVLHPCSSIISVLHMCI